MPNIKSPLITNWSDDLRSVPCGSSAEENDASLSSTGLTAKAIKSQLEDVFAGDDIRRLPTINGKTTHKDNNDDDVFNNANIDLLSIPAGVYRIYQNAIGTTITGTFPSISDCTGYLVIHKVVGDLVEAGQPDETGQKVRQILYPDDPTNPSPWTRVGRVGTGNAVWSSWDKMGGGLRRVIMTGDTTAQFNVMYESFGNYTLTLPDPATVPVGTKIGLEQWGIVGLVNNEYKLIAGANGAVVCTYGNNSYCQGTEALYNPAVGVIAQSYIFECVEYCNTTSPETSREWVLECEGNDAESIKILNSRLSNLEAINTRPIKYMIHPPTTIVVDSTDRSKGYNLYFYDQYIHASYSANEFGELGTILPVEDENTHIPIGAKVTFELYNDDPGSSGVAPQIRSAVIGHDANLQETFQVYPGTRLLVSLMWVPYGRHYDEITSSYVDDYTWSKISVY